MQIKEQTKALKQADGVLLSEHVWVYTFTYALQVHLPAIQPDCTKSMRDFPSFPSTPPDMFTIKEAEQVWSLPNKNVNNYFKYTKTCCFSFSLKPKGLVRCSVYYSQHFSHHPGF